MCGNTQFLQVLRLGWWGGAGKFPFGDPDAANGKHGVQNMIAKIMKVNFDEPEGLSPDLEALLRSVLVSDPAARPSIQQLLAHPWVSVGLPPGMLQCNDKVRSLPPFYNTASPGVLPGLTWLVIKSYSLVSPACLC